MSPSPTHTDASPATMQTCVAAIGDVLAIVASPRDAASLVGQRLAAHAQGAVTGCALPSAFLGGGRARREPSVMALLTAPTAAGHTHDMEPGGDGDSFVRMAHVNGVSQAGWTVIDAEVTHGLRTLAEWHDLVVVQKPADDLASPLDGFDDLVLGLGIPCLVLPTVCAPSGVFDRVVVAWDGSGASTRALRASLPLLAAAQDILLLDGSPRHSRHDLPRFEPMRFFSRHGIEATRRHLETTPSAAGATLLERSRRFKADLLVMGAYGHSRLRERMTGGATRHVLAHGTIPTFLHH